MKGGPQLADEEGQEPRQEQGRDSRGDATRTAERQGLQERDAEDHEEESRRKADEEAMEEANQSQKHGLIRTVNRTREQQGEADERPGTGASEGKDSNGEQHGERRLEEGVPRPREIMPRKGPMRQTRSKAP